jgi:diguanylate cyclase (GGDEF)-like protein
MNKLTDFIAEHSNSKWNDYVNEFATFIRRTLLTYGDFRAILDRIIDHPNSKITGLKFEIKSVDSKAVVFKYDYTTESSSPDNLDTEYLDTHNWFNFEYSIWYGSNVQKDGTAKDEVKRLIKLLINAFWKTSSRDEKTRIWTKLVPDTGQLINSTLTYYKNKCHYITILYCDLDKFKSLNDTHGGSAGDGVLLQMADLFTGFIVDEPAILLHDKGDEFIILVFTMYIEDALSIAFRFQQRLKSNTFEVKTANGAEKVESEVTVGINIRYTLTNDDISFSTEIQYAELAIKDGGGSKRYGIANLYNADKQAFDLCQLSEFTANGSKLNLKVASGQRIFRNVWLNLISELVQRILGSGGALTEMKTVLEWIKPAYAANCSSFYEYGTQPDYTKDISSFDVLIAIMRGIIENDTVGRSENAYRIISSNGEMTLFERDKELFKLPSAEVIDLEIGTFFKGQIVPVALLVKIGHEKLPIPEQIFSSIIIVDDRPSRGGGLPDFWELALAKVVNQVNKDPNIKFVYIIGESQYGSNTVSWLEKIAKNEIQPQDVETIIYKIRATNSAIENTKRRLNNAVSSYESIETIVKAYADFITDGKEIVTEDQEFIEDRPPVFLQKDVRINDYALTVEDGFKVKTLAEAYPLMLEVARLSTGSSNSIRDQARGFLGELIDFKVELSNPTKDLIPFYYRADKKKFEAYFNKLFIQAEGLFAKFLNTQLEAVLKHIEESITTERKQYSTRRAILIIPNQINGDDLMPLGLVSLRIIPRVKNPKSVGLVFSYTWRTVEALVGFPYSLYGSVKYGEYIQGLLQERVSSMGINITFDKVSYIANSLHIFMDEQGQAIAKSIINDASI